MGGKIRKLLPRLYLDDWGSQTEITSNEPHQPSRWFKLGQEARNVVIREGKGGQREVCEKCPRGR